MSRRHRRPPVVVSQCGQPHPSVRALEIAYVDALLKSSFQGIRAPVIEAELREDWGEIECERHAEAREPKPQPPTSA